MMKLLEFLIWAGIVVLISTWMAGCAPMRDQWGGNNPTWTKEDLRRAVGE